MGIELTQLEYIESTQTMSSMKISHTIGQKSTHKVLIRWKSQFTKLWVDCHKFKSTIKDLSQLEKGHKVIQLSWLMQDESIDVN